MFVLQGRLEYESNMENRSIVAMLSVRRCWLVLYRRMDDIDEAIERARGSVCSGVSVNWKIVFCNVAGIYLLIIGRRCMVCRLYVE